MIVGVFWLFAASFFLDLFCVRLNTSHIDISNELSQYFWHQTVIEFMNRAAQRQFADFIICLYISEDKLVII